MRYLHSFVRSAHVSLSHSLSPLSLKSFFQMLLSSALLQCKSYMFSFPLQSFFTQLHRSYNHCSETISKKLTVRIQQVKSAKRFPPAPYKKKRTVSMGVCLFGMVYVVTLVTSPFSVMHDPLKQFSLSVSFIVHLHLFLLPSLTLPGLPLFPSSRSCTEQLVSCGCDCPQLGHPPPQEQS